MIHDEDSRVKIPAILHLTRLGYSYVSLKGSQWDETTNIFPELFRCSIAAINPVATFFDLIERHHAQNKELTTLRDWLLPMPMNGQVRVG